jgi:iron complex transport system substrate-binding protein
MLSLSARTITDDYGRVVEIPKKITKIYAASPPLTMSVLAFNPELITALNTPFSDAQKPFVGSAFNKPVAGGFFGQGQTPNFEVLASSKPDVILMWGKMSGAQNILEKLQKLGIPVLLVKNDSIKDLITQFELYAKLTGDTKRRDELIRYTKETLTLIDSLQSKLAQEKSVRYYFAESLDGLSSECEGSFHLEPFDYAGAKNALDCKMSSNYGMEKISLEKILVANPQVIVAMDAIFAKEVQTNPQWQNLQAVREGKVFVVPSLPFNYITRPPSFMRLMGIRWLIHTFYPALLSSSSDEELKRFNELFFKNQTQNKETK